MNWHVRVQLLNMWPVSSALALWRNAQTREQLVPPSCLLEGARGMLNNDCQWHKGGNEHWKWSGSERRVKVQEDEEWKERADFPEGARSLWHGASNDQTNHDQTSLSNGCSASGSGLQCLNMQLLLLCSLSCCCRLSTLALSPQPC